MSKVTTPTRVNQEGRTPEIRKKEGNPKYLSKGYHHHTKCITTTLLATLMRRRPLNSATLATATHKELREVSNGTGPQV